MKERPKVKPMFRQVIGAAPAPKAACDIETEGLGGKYLDGCITLQDQPNRHYHFPSIGRMLSFMAAHPKYDFYFHNGSGYDFSYFVPALYRVMEASKASVTLIKQGSSRIIGLQLACKSGYGKGKIVTIKDSLPLLNMALKKATEHFAPELPKGDIGLAEGVIYDRKNPEHVAYLHRDCDALLAVLLRFDALVLDQFGTSSGWTAGSTAIRAWKACIPEGDAYYRNRREVEDFVRRAYYGGFVYPGQDTLVHQDITSIDFNAHYAASMRKGVPYGAPVYDVDFQPDFPGVWHVSVVTPKTVPYPCIPSRDKDGNLRWAIGSFESYVCTEEISFARERGYTIEVIDGYWYPRLEYPFQEFLERCEKLELVDGGALKQMAKLFRNALYGKFGSKIISSSFRISYDVAPDTATRPVIDETTGEMVPGLVETMDENDSDYIMPIWAAYITMNARLSLFRLMEAVGVEHVRYCDTDSVKADAMAVQAMLDNGYVQVCNGYGNVKIDEKYEWFQCLGAKNYRGKLRDDEPEPGDTPVPRYIGKVKGIPARSLSTLAHFLAAHNQSPQVGFQSINGILPRIKHPGLAIPHHRTRTVGGMDKSKSWRVDPKTRRVSPYTVNEKVV